MVARAYVNFREKKRWNKIRGYAFWIVHKVSRMFRRKLRRRRALGELMHLRKICDSMTMLAVCQNEWIYNRQLQVLKPWLMLNVGILPLVKAAYITYQKFCTIQRKNRDYLAVRFSKTEVLINYWDKMIGKLTLKADIYDDDLMRDILFKIVNIPKEVQLGVLTIFVQSCRDIYQIAFYQWRKMYPSRVRFDKDELNRLIYARINSVFKLVTKKVPSIKTL